MRGVVLLALLWGMPLFAVSGPPIEVVIIGVPSTHVDAYSTSPLGAENVEMCNGLEAFFSEKAVHVNRLCDPDTTTSDYVSKWLTAYFQDEARGHLTLIFFMSHGEPTDNGDVRLIMSDTTDQTKSTNSILLHQYLASLVLNARGAVAIAFVDACFSGAATPALPVAEAAAEGVGVHAGLIASAQADEQSLNLSFTKSLLETWKNDCPQTEDDFISTVYKHMGTSGSSPVPLISYHGSLCFRELLAPDKRVISVWRDPQKQLLVSLFRDTPEPSTQVRVIPPNPTFTMPFIEPGNQGTYHVEIVDYATRQVKDKQYCNTEDETYCRFIYPPEPDKVSLLKVEVDSYKGAVALGYSNEALSKISSRAALVYGGLSQGPDITRSLADAIVKSSPVLWSRIQQYREGKEVPFQTAIGQVDDPDVQANLRSAFLRITKGDSEGGAAQIEDASKTVRHSKSLTQQAKDKISQALRDFAKTVRKEGVSRRALNKMDKASEAIAATSRAGKA